MINFDQSEFAFPVDLNCYHRYHFALCLPTLTAQVAAAFSLACNLSRLLHLPFGRIRPAGRGPTQTCQTLHCQPGPT